MGRSSGNWGNTGKSGEVQGTGDNEGKKSARWREVGVMEQWLKGAVTRLAGGKLIR